MQTTVPKHDHILTGAAQQVANTAEHPIIGAGNGTQVEARFPKMLRLRAHTEFQHVFQARCSVADDRVVLYVRRNGMAASRLGLIVSRKLGNAVQRNRWKRLLREAFRLSRGELAAGMDLVVIPRAGASPDLPHLRQSLKSLLRRAQRKLARQKGADGA